MLRIIVPEKTENARQLVLKNKPESSLVVKHRACEGITFLAITATFLPTTLQKINLGQTSS